jgi:hypothetical protein
MVIKSLLFPHGFRPIRVKIRLKFSLPSCRDVKI